MRYLLKNHRKLIEKLLVSTLKEECEWCDFSLCPRHLCVFYNTSINFKNLFTFYPPMYKHWIYYFMHNPYKNWSFPDETPGKWHIHHLDNDHYNDEKENLVMLLNADHTKLHTKKYFSGDERPSDLNRIMKNPNYCVFYL